MTQPPIQTYNLTISNIWGCPLDEKEMADIIQFAIANRGEVDVRVAVNFNKAQRVLDTYCFNVDSINSELYELICGNIIINSIAEPNLGIDYEHWESDDGQNHFIYAKCVNKPNDLPLLGIKWIRIYEISI